MLSNNKILGFVATKVSNRAKTFYVDVLGLELSGGLKERGVQFETYTWMSQDSLGIWNSPSGSRVAWLKDPDGNALSISQHAN